MSDEALIEKNAVEIVKQMQKLRGIDGEYDSETGKTTEPDSLKKTIFHFNFSNDEGLQSSLAEFADSQPEPTISKLINFTNRFSFIFSI